MHTNKPYVYKITNIAKKKKHAKKKERMVVIFWDTNRYDMFTSSHSIFSFGSILNPYFFL